MIAHSEPILVSRLINTLINCSHKVAVHYDAKRPIEEFDALVREFDKNDDVQFAKRVPVAWAEWSVVEATLNCLDVIEAAGWEPDYVYLMSGSDYPIRASRDLETFLERNNGDEFIESVPADTVKWVKSGPQRERYQYRWFTNWRAQPFLTNNIFELQKRLHLERPFVRQMIPHLGSQWWVMTWSTLKQIMRLAREPDIVAFFRTTLVPDELFFQTLVRQIVTDHRVIGCTLTLYQFTDYGYPVVYHADHIDYLVRQRFFMARKLSSQAMTLRDRLDAFWVGEKKAPAFEDEDVGIRSSEYEDWRLAHREGAPNAPLIAATDPGRAVRSIGKPQVCIMGTSTTELKLLHSIIGRNQNVTMHGQIFHPAAIEFAGAESSFASYDVKDVHVRDVSRGDFLLDIVRARPAHATAYLVRWGQGKQIMDSLMQRANVKVIVLDGDPLVSFSENLMGVHYLLDEPFRPEDLKTVPPDAAANRFRVFLKEYQQQLGVLDKRLQTSKTTKPKGWAVRLGAPRYEPGWLTPLENCFGIKLTISADDFAAEAAATAADHARRRECVTALLVEGGIDAEVFDCLKQGSEGLALAISLV